VALTLEKVNHGVWAPGAADAELGGLGGSAGGEAKAEFDGGGFCGLAADALAKEVAVAEVASAGAERLN